MLRTIRDAAPTVLVPAAWLVVVATQRGFVGEDALFVAHLVMAVFIAGFAVTGWSDMHAGALRAWRTVLVAGLAVTLAGIAGFRLDLDALLAVSIVGWMLLPAGGLLYTGRVFAAARRVYYGSGALTVLGAAVYVVALAGQHDLATLIGIASVGVGQTAGIVDAAVRSD